MGRAASTAAGSLSEEDVAVRPATEVVAPGEGEELELLELREVRQRPESVAGGDVELSVGEDVAAPNAEPRRLRPTRTSSTRSWTRS